MRTQDVPTRSRNEGRMKLFLVLAVVILLTISVYKFLDGDNPVKVLSCTWDRVAQDAPATTSADCR